MSMSDHPTTDPLFVGATRPAMLWRVTYSGGNLKHYRCDDAVSQCQQ